MLRKDGMLAASSEPASPRAGQRGERSRRTGALVPVDRGASGGPSPSSSRARRRGGGPLRRAGSLAVADALERGGRALGLAADVSDLGPGRVVASVERASAVDVLVNDAGIALVARSVRCRTPTGTVLAVNLSSPFWPAAACRGWPSGAGAG